MLNGTMKPAEGFGDSAFGSLSAPTPTTNGNGIGGASSPPADGGGFG